MLRITRLHFEHTIIIIDTYDLIAEKVVHFLKSHSENVFVFSQVFLYDEFSKTSRRRIHFLIDFIIEFQFFLNYFEQTVRDRKILEVHIDKGMHDGQKIVFNGEGDQEPGLEPGDIVVLLEEKDHPVYK